MNPHGIFVNLKCLFVCFGGGEILAHNELADFDSQLVLYENGWVSQSPAETSLVVVVEVAAVIKY